MQLPSTSSTSSTYNSQSHTPGLGRCLLRPSWSGISRSPCSFFCTFETLHLLGFSNKMLSILSLIVWHKKTFNRKTSTFIFYSSILITRFSGALLGKVISNTFMDFWCKNRLIKGQWIKMDGSTDPRGWWAPAKRPSMEILGSRGPGVSGSPLHPWNGCTDLAADCSPWRRQLVHKMLLQMGQFLHRDGMSWQDSA